MAHFQCCVCGHSIDDDLFGSITVPVVDGGLQELRAHGRCLAGVMHPSVPVAWESGKSWQAKAPLRTTLGSDIARDAMFLELLHENGDTARQLAEATFNEATRRIVLRAEFAALSFDDVTGFLRLSRTTFYPGIDGSDPGAV